MVPEPGRGPAGLPGPKPLPGAVPARAQPARPGGPGRAHGPRPGQGPGRADARPGHARGIQQVAQQVAEYSYGHAHFGARADGRFGALDALLSLFESAGVTSGGGNAGGSMSSTSSQDAARRPDNATRTPAGQGCNPGNVGLAQDPARHGPQRAVGRPPGAVRGPRTVK